VSYEWCAPGLRPMLDDPMFRSLDITTAIPALATASLLGERTVLRIDEVPASFREPFERAGMTSMLFTPVMTEDKLWGGLWFMDSAAPPRAWNWAETDTLTTLAGLIGVSTTRSRYVKELADANTIVQNSPTVLYRLKGEPLLPVTYVSHNITKFGYDPKKLVADEATFQTMVQMLIHPDDQAKLFDAISEVVSKNAGGGTIEARLTAPGGAIRWIENRYTPVRDEIGRLVEIEGIITDVTERKLAEEKIAALARTDALTGLANRATFVERLHQAFASSRRGAPAFAVLYLDLDHFKDVNDTRGHPTGDLLLREAGERLKARARESDIVARLGGDEFAILQMDIAGPADAGALASDIVAALAVPYLIEDNKLRVTASVGISPFTPDLADPDAMLAQADLALYRAKEEGRDQFRFHTAELDRDVNERVTIAEDLRSALERDELFLQYQPQVELMSGRIVGMEALVRWRHPVRGTLRPAAFIPIAESTGVIHALGHWVLENACRQMRTWKDQGVAPPTIAINISMLQLKNGADLVHDIANTLAETGLDAGELELDVTESMLARVNFAQNDVIDQLKALGVKIALDDFGADYSSFDYLRAYRVNHLKVARQFIENATRDASLAATVRAILGAAHELGIQVIAEGVETSDQRALLLSIGANTRGQGFYFSEPVDVGNATELLTLGSIDRRDKPAAGA
jgi:diguanylate cyclase (GGDEF)-like protein/PAS domain S-box-containing protein